MCQFSREITDEDTTINNYCWISKEKSKKQNWTTLFHKCVVQHTTLVNYRFQFYVRVYNIFFSVRKSFSWLGVRIQTTHLIP
jgi:hypothetical protein